MSHGTAGPFFGLSLSRARVLSLSLTRFLSDILRQGRPVFRFQAQGGHLRRRAHRICHGTALSPVMETGIPGSSLSPSLSPSDPSSSSSPSLFHSIILCLSASLPLSLSLQMCLNSSCTLMTAKGPLHKPQVWAAGGGGAPARHDPGSARCVCNRI